MKKSGKFGGDQKQQVSLRRVHIEIEKQRIEVHQKKIQKLLEEMTEQNSGRNKIIQLMGRQPSLGNCAGKEGRQKWKNYTGRNGRQADPTGIIAIDLKKHSNEFDTTRLRR